MQLVCFKLASVYLQLPKPSVSGCKCRHLLLKITIYFAPLQVRTLVMKWSCLFTSITLQSIWTNNSYFDDFTIAWYNSHCCKHTCVFTFFHFKICLTESLFQVIFCKSPIACHWISIIVSLLTIYYLLPPLQVCHMSFAEAKKKFHQPVTLMR